MSRSSLKNRIESVEEECLIENPVDILYLTGLAVSRGRLWISRSGAEKEAKLFVDPRYYEQAKKEAPCAVFEEKTFPEAFKSARRVAFDSAFITVEKFAALEKNFPGIEFVPIPKLLKRIRVKKDPAEIALLREAARLTWSGFEKIEEYLQEGISEEQLALEFEIYCRKNGASSLSFEPIIAFGENSAYPHHRAGRTKLRKNEIVLIDIGAVVQNYRADMTRVVFWGTPDPCLARFYELARRAQQWAVSAVRPGIRAGALDRMIHEAFQKEGVEALYTHSLGHGIGLEAHEYPLIRIEGEDRDLILEEGMVFTIEPGLYQPGLGGVRYEDTLLVTKRGCENFYPQDARKV